jgi:hypothetical protein
MVRHAISFLVAKTMDKYVLLALDFCVTTTTSFDLWMSRLRDGTFDIVINFINSQWVPCHVIVRLF